MLKTMRDDLRRLVLSNMALNAIFVLMALSEMTGLTTVHQALPWYLKWIWIVVLAAGNLGLHLAMIERLNRPD